MRVGGGAAVLLLQTTWEEAWECVRAETLYAMLDITSARLAASSPSPATYLQPSSTFRRSRNGVRCDDCHSTRNWLLTYTDPGAGFGLMKGGDMILIQVARGSLSVLGLGGANHAYC